MGITYSIDEKNKIITETWSDNITLEEYKNSKLREFSDPKYKPDFDIITDLSKLTTGIDDKVKEGIIDFLKTNTDKIKAKKNAVVANNPQKVASTLFFDNKYINRQISISIFSTVDAAKKWIKEIW